MNNTIGQNIYELRKKNNFTQEELANKLNISFQAISKWENGVSYPDISLLPIIADLFKVSIDSLLNYAVEQRKISYYEKRYDTSEYYWGVKPNNMCYEILKLMPPDKPLRLLDIGCGEGKDAVFWQRTDTRFQPLTLLKQELKKQKD